MKKLFVFILIISKIISSSEKNLIIPHVNWEPHDKDLIRPSDADIASSDNLINVIIKLIEWNKHSSDKFTISSQNSSADKTLNIVYYSVIDNAPINISYTVKNIAQETNFENKSIWSYRAVHTYPTYNCNTEQLIKGLFARYSQTAGITSAQKEHLKMLEETVHAQRTNTCKFKAKFNARMLQHQQPFLPGFTSHRRERDDQQNSIAISSTQNNSIDTVPAKLDSNQNNQQCRCQQHLGLFKKPETFAFSSSSSVSPSPQKEY